MLKDCSEFSLPGIGRRLVDKMKDSPKMARRVMTKMTSPSVGRRRQRRLKEEEESIFVVSVNVVHSSGQQSTNNETKMDAWSVSSTIDYCLTTASKASDESLDHCCFAYVTSVIFP